jgi:predicted MFS family arabinose efflux permease
MLAGINKDPARQQRAFAMNFTGINAGIGVGAAIGAAVANPADPASFQVLFLANAASCVLFAALLVALPNVRSEREAHQSKGGYREVLANRPLRTVLLAILVLAFTGYAALDSGLPAYATVQARVSVHVVALSLTLNTAVIVISQLFVLRLVRRLRRSRALSVIGLIWAASWAVFGLSALPGSPDLRIACVLVFAGMFAIGETFMAPTTSPLVNSLAGEQVRGRANALSSMAYSIAFVVSPAICTGMIAAGLGAVWISLLCACCFGTVLLGLRLGRQLDPRQDAVQEAEPLAAEPALT